MTTTFPPATIGYGFSHAHLLGIEPLSPGEIAYLLDRASSFADLAPNEAINEAQETLEGSTVINLFFENSTRTRSSFEIAAQRLGADVVNMDVATSSVKKGETLIDTADTLNAMRPDFLVVRHDQAGAVKLLSRKLDAHVLNGGDGKHEHPTQALADALTMRRHKGKLDGLTVAICGDIRHSRVARSNLLLLQKMGARVRLIGPPTLLPGSYGSLGADVFNSMEEGLKDVDIVMMLRLQVERMAGTYIPSGREFFQHFGLDRERLALAKPDALVMHPGPMNRGVEIASDIADDLDQSVIREQVEMGVAVRMACFEALATRRGPTTLRAA
ncbi:MAG: aspartate carbamoyltransferase catalytic subunit [Alphaproteobacteria bacterium]